MLWRRACLVILLGSLVFGLLPNRALSSDIAVEINNQPLRFEVAPFNSQGYLLVPMRTIFAALGADVAWDAASKTVEATKGELRIELPIGAGQASINGIPTKLDMPAQIVSGSTMVPLRFVAESLGADVAWDQANRTVRISAEGQPIVQDVGVAADTGFQGRTKQEVINAWQTYKPKYDGTPFAAENKISNPHEIGKLEAAYVTDSVNMVNFVRYLAGVPHDVKADGTLNDQAQHGAVLLNVIGQLNHTPAKPQGMAEAFYKVGYEATSTSNISYYRYSTTASMPQAIEEGQKRFSVAESVIQYMQDQDDFNLALVGHRRWLLNPALQKVGVGISHHAFVDGKWSVYEQFSAMKIMDDSRGTTHSFDYIAWPSQGAFPTAFFKYSDQYGSDPWSISLNPKRYTKPVLSEVRVELTRTSDNHTWVLDQRHNKVQSKTNYFNVDTQYYGVPYSIVFRPEISREYGDGEQYAVKITGIKDINGNPTSISYTTTFFTLP